MLSNPWIGVRDGDPRVRGLYNRHYSARKYADGRRPLKTLGPGEYMLLLTVDGTAVFGWVHNTVQRDDRQEGLYCALFRNEGILLSSYLILMAENLARRRWPDILRYFTYVDTEKVRSPNPGYCFKMAGWEFDGVSKTGKHRLVKEMT